SNEGSPIVESSARRRKAAVRERRSAVRPWSRREARPRASLSTPEDERSIPPVFFSRLESLLFQHRRPIDEDGDRNIRCMRRNINDEMLAVGRDVVLVARQIAEAANRLTRNIYFEQRRRFAGFDFSPHLHWNGHEGSIGRDVELPDAQRPLGRSSP